MRWPVALTLGILITSGLTGCRGGGRAARDNLESELRNREEDVRQLREDLDRAECFNQALSRELSAVRCEPGPNGVVERPSMPYPVQTLRIGRGTGGRAAECGGDDALQLQVEPVDCEGQTIKAPGNLYVEVTEITKEGLKRPLSSWDLPQDQLRGKWQNGLFSTGYMLTLPWKAPPMSEKLRVLARLSMLDGRVFEADRDITVRIMPEHQRRILISPSITPMPSPGMIIQGPAGSPALPSPLPSGPLPSGPIPSGPLSVPVPGVVPSSPLPTPLPNAPLPSSPGTLTVPPKPEVIVPPASPAPIPRVDTKTTPVPPPAKMLPMPKAETTATIDGPILPGQQTPGITVKARLYRPVPLPKD